MHQRRNILLKGLIVILSVIVICTSISRIIGIGSTTLEDIAREYPQPTATPKETGEDGRSNTPPPVSESGDDAYPIESTPKEPENMTTPEDTNTALLTGASLNGELMAHARITWAEGFYFEPLSEDLARYITGISYPEDIQAPAITVAELCYVHVLYYDFDGQSTEGELICNQAIAQDLVEIFHELHRAEYQIERIRLIDEYGGDDDLSMEDNNTSCFNYRAVSGSASLSKHAYGLAVDINPLYNPYITYNKDHSINVAPAAGEEYADRSRTFPYKIDENDLCCRLFKEHGFTWGGDWNSCKDYQHFQKTP